MSARCARLLWLLPRRLAPVHSTLRPLAPAGLQHISGAKSCILPRRARCRAPDRVDRGCYRPHRARALAQRGPGAVDGGPELVHGAADDVRVVQHAENKVSRCHRRAHVRRQRAGGVGKQHAVRWCARGQRRRSFAAGCHSPVRAIAVASATLSARGAAAAGAQGLLRCRLAERRPAARLADKPTPPPLSRTPARSAPPLALPSTPPPLSLLVRSHSVPRRGRTATRITA